MDAIQANNSKHQVSLTQKCHTLDVIAHNVLQNTLDKC